MGQKVSPIGLRTGINLDWKSRWYANKQDFGRLLCVIRFHRPTLPRKLRMAP